jgi:hypothetical protein
MSDERAGFLEEKSEERIEPDLLVCEAKQRGFQGEWPPWSEDAVREGGQGAKRTLEGKKRSFFPPRSQCGKSQRDFEVYIPSLAKDFLAGWSNGMK